MTDTTGDLKRAFAAWAKEKSAALKHMTVDKILAEFEREQQVRRELEKKPDA